MLTHTQPAAPAPMPGARVLVVEARYYDGIADELLAGARAAVEAAGAVCHVLTVAGALEIPPTIAIALREAERTGTRWDAAVALGCVIRGETGHYDIVAGESSRALMDLSVREALPIGNGILTVENEGQAWARARTTEMNKGGGAALAALGVLAVARRLAGADVPSRADLPSRADVPPRADLPPRADGRTGERA